MPDGADHGWVVAPPDADAMAALLADVAADSTSFDVLDWVASCDVALADAVVVARLWPHAPPIEPVEGHLYRLELSVEEREALETRLSLSAHRSVRCAVALHTAAAAVQLHLALDPVDVVVAALAVRVDTLPRALQELMTAPSSAVKPAETVARFTAQPDLLLRLAEHRSVDVRRAVAGRLAGVRLLPMEPHVRHSIDSTLRRAAA